MSLKEELKEASEAVAAVEPTAKKYGKIVLIIVGVVILAALILGLLL